MLAFPFVVFISQAEQGVPMNMEVKAMTGAQVVATVNP